LLPLAYKCSDCGARKDGEFIEFCMNQIENKKEEK